MSCTTSLTSAFPGTIPRTCRLPMRFRPSTGTPAATSNAYYESGYYLITGQGTLFPNSGPLGPDQITDDPTQTILVTEGSPLVPSGMWTEPIDLDFSNMQGRLGTNPGIEPGGRLDEGVAIATADGRGHFVGNSIEPSVFRALRDATRWRTTGRRYARLIRRSADTPAVIACRHRCCSTESPPVGRSTRIDWSIG